MGTVSAVGFCVRITHPWSSDSSARRLRVDTASELLTPSEISTEQCPHWTLNCRPHAWETMDGQHLSSNFLDRFYLGTTAQKPFRPLTLSFHQKSKASLPQRNARQRHHYTCSPECWSQDTSALEIISLQTFHRGRLGEYELIVTFPNSAGLVPWDGSVNNQCGNCRERT